MSSVKEMEKCFSSCHERGKKIKDNRNKIERKKTPDSYQKRDRDLGRGGVYKCYVKNKQTTVRLCCRKTNVVFHSQLPHGTLKKTLIS